MVAFFFIIKGVFSMLHRFFHFLKQSLLVVLCILLLGGLLAGGWFFYQGRQLYRSAAMRAWNSLTSTILISSRITTSHLSRFLSLWMKLTTPPV